MDLSRANTLKNMTSDLGPQVFVAETSTFTPAHIDGGGIFDSIHLCILGCNEVILLDQLEEEDDVRNAFQIINQGDGHVDLTEDPHDTEGRFLWPSQDTI